MPDWEDGLCIFSGEEKEIGQSWVFTGGAEIITHLTLCWIRFPRIMPFTPWIFRDVESQHFPKSGR